MENPVILPVPPDLKGMAWRLINSEDTAPLASLTKTCIAADGGIPFIAEPPELTGYFFPEGSGTGIGAFDADGRMVACATVHISDYRKKQRAMIAGQVHPDLRGRGIGRFLMNWSREQALILLKDVPTEQRLLHIRTESLTEPANRLYLAHGFTQVDEHLVMERDISRTLPDRTLPPSVTITSWQPTLAGQFFQAYDAAFRERPGFPGWTADEWVDSWTNENFRPEWSLLAREGDIPVGFMIGSANPPQGFVVQIGVIPTHRRRGLSSGIMVEGMRRMQAAGMVSIQLTVNLNNPGAIQNYFDLGFTTIGRRAHYERISER